MQDNAQQDRQQHQHQVLFNQVSDRQDDTHALPHQPGSPAHHNGDGKQGNDTAECRQGHGKGHISPAQFGKYVRGTTARTTGDEHQADKENRRQPEQVSQPQGDERQQYQLSRQGHGDGPGIAEYFPEIFQPQAQPQVEHQERENGQHYPNRIHLVRI